MDATVDDDVLPELSFDQSTPSSNADKTSSLGSPSPQGIILHPHTLEELESNMAQTLDADALCSQFLRSPSPPDPHKEGEGSPVDDQVRLPPQLITPRDICLFVERDPHLAGLVDEDASTLENSHITTKKPRITLKTSLQAESRKVRDAVLVGIQILSRFMKFSTLDSSS